MLFLYYVLYENTNIGNDMVMLRELLKKQGDIWGFEEILNIQKIYMKLEISKENKEKNDRGR